MRRVAWIGTWGAIGYLAWRDRKRERALQTLADELGGWAGRLGEEVVAAFETMVKRINANNKELAKMCGAEVRRRGDA